MIDIERCRRAVARIQVGGVPLGSIRQKALADAIARIQYDGWVKLAGEYIGVKQYAGFGDQREDHQEGYGPKHGSIVFRIQRTGQGPLGGDEIYLLECVRDFGVVEGPPSQYAPHQPQRWNLCDVLHALAKAEREASSLRAHLAAAAVDSHETVPA